ncbi:MAG: hypothetical protein SVY53_12055 [Chloroflexota bacterium]|nr:hypothetical protein [Chloroflexota bacterium]
MKGLNKDDYEELYEELREENERLRGQIVHLKQKQQELKDQIQCHINARSNAS